MRKVIGIGETILDIIFKGDKPIEAVPGGSTFNCMVSLGRAGVPATFISEIGADRVGDHVLRFIEQNGVDTSCINVYPGAKSPVSLAFLNERNEASYAFYREPPRDRTDFRMPDIQPDDIVVLGSFFALDPAIRPRVAELLSFARDRGAIIYYDINFRPAHKTDAMRVTPNLLENLEFADIVRASSEDFSTLYKNPEPDHVYKAEISFYCKRMICTRGADATLLHSDGGLRKEYPTPPTDTVSTIGAGDNFNAGLVYGLLREGVTRADLERGLSETVWDRLIASAQEFAAECCKDIFNYVSQDFGNTKKAPFHRG